MKLKKLINFEPESSALDQAQALAWNAMDEPNSKKRIELAKKALKLSEDCADAYLILAEVADSKVELYEKAVEAGRRAIGPKDFKDYHGHFWGFIETRPFMRAKQYLAQSLMKQGNLDEAIKHYQEMLELNPNDNQGIRYILLHCLFRKGLDEEIAKLFDQYPDDAFADFYYHRALWLFRKEGASGKSNALLKASIQDNPHIPKYLLGKKKIPKRSPEYIQLGGESEAIVYVKNTRTDWEATDGALTWLKEHFES